MTDLDNTFALNIVRQVGGYGEAYERNGGKGSFANARSEAEWLTDHGRLTYALPFQ